MPNTGKRLVILGVLVAMHGRQDRTTPDHGIGNAAARTQSPRGILMLSFCAYQISFRIQPIFQVIVLEVFDKKECLTYHFSDYALSLPTPATEVKSSRTALATAFRLVYFRDRTRSTLKF